MMSEKRQSFITTGEGFRPQRLDGLRWWYVHDWPEAHAAASGMWPGKEFWSEQEWRDLYAEGYRYCALLRDGHSLAVAGLWPRTEPEWEVIAVGTAPGHRNHGYAKAVVTFVTEDILSHTHAAGITARHDNIPMLRVIEHLGFGPNNVGEQAPAYRASRSG